MMQIDKILMIISMKVLMNKFDSHILNNNKIIKYFFFIFFSFCYSYFDIFSISQKSYQKVNIQILQNINNFIKISKITDFIVFNENVNSNVRFDRTF